MPTYAIRKGYTYETGHRFMTQHGRPLEVTGFLGRGGQGEVYRVRGTDGEYAVKWYHAAEYLEHIQSGAFYQNLARNVENGVPTLSSGDAATQFIWPLDLVQPADGSFGYVMKLFPEGYEPLKNVFMLRRKNADGTVTGLTWKSWFTCVTAALNIVRAFEILHASGLSYQDLNDGGISLNMHDGSALICDCDNVSPDKTNLGIRGIMTYMAPEVVRGEKLPDRLTDQYSLAVILFRLFLHGHPMAGRESRQLHNSERLSQFQADQLIYSLKPHYCLASHHNANPPDPVWHADVCRLALTFPLRLMDAFEQVFTQGIEDPSRRLTATEWRRVLLEVRDSLLLVDGKEQFFRVRRPKPLPESCRTLVYPHGMRVLCMPGKILYRCHLDEYGTDFLHPVGKIIPTSRSGVIGLYNATGAPVRFEANGREGVCPDHGRLPLLPGMRLFFGGTGVSVE